MKEIINYINEKLKLSADSKSVKNDYSVFGKGKITTLNKSDLPFEESLSSYDISCLQEKFKQYISLDDEIYCIEESDGSGWSDFHNINDDFKKILNEYVNHRKANNIKKITDFEPTGHIVIYFIDSFKTFKNICVIQCYNRYASQNEVNMAWYIKVNNK